MNISRPKDRPVTSSLTLEKQNRGSRSHGSISSFNKNANDKNGLLMADRDLVQQQIPLKDRNDSTEDNGTSSEEEYEVYFGEDMYCQDEYNEQWSTDEDNGEDKCERESSSASNACCTLRGRIYDGTDFQMQHPQTIHNTGELTYTVRDRFFSSDFRPMPNSVDDPMDDVYEGDEDLEDELDYDGMSEDDAEEEDNDAHYVGDRSLSRFSEPDVISEAWRILDRADDEIWTAIPPADIDQLCKCQSFTRFELDRLNF